MQIKSFLLLGAISTLLLGNPAAATPTLNEMKRPVPLQLSNRLVEQVDPHDGLHYVPSMPSSNPDIVAPRRGVPITHSTPKIISGNGTGPDRVKYELSNGGVHIQPRDIGPSVNTLSPTPQLDMSKPAMLHPPSEGKPSSYYSPNMEEPTMPLFENHPPSMVSPSHNKTALSAKDPSTVTVSYVATTVTRIHTITVTPSKATKTVALISFIDATSTVTKPEEATSASTTHNITQLEPADSTVIVTSTVFSESTVSITNSINVIEYPQTIWVTESATKKLTVPYPTTTVWDYKTTWFPGNYWGGERWTTIRQPSPDIHKAKF